MGFLWSIGWFVVTTAVAAVMFGAQVSPDQAVSNLYLWAQRCGIKHPPKWLRERSADRKIRRISFFILLALFFVGGVMAEQWYRKIGIFEGITQDSDVKMTITNVTFPGDDTRQFFVSMHLENRGAASTVKDGVLCVISGRDLYMRYEPREFITGPTLNQTLQYQRGIYLSREPLAAGGQIDAEIRYAVHGDASVELKHKGIKLVLIASDIFGRNIVADYVIP